jgi:tetratricopeptide (TPR) repeat protein
MKHSLTPLLVFAALAFSPAQAQSTTPAGGSLNMPPFNTPSLPAAKSSTAPAVEAKPVVVPEDRDAAFTAAVAAYEKGDYARARALFAGTEKKAVSAALEYNFGNACYQAGDYGAAILHYLRALSLDPHDPDARQNLALARKAASAPTLDESRLDRFSAMLSRNAWTWVFTVAGWAAVYLAFLPGLYRWRGMVPWSLFATTLVIAVAGGIGWWGAQKHAHDGVVLQVDAALLTSPTTNSPSVTTLQLGEIAQTLEQHGSYYKVLTSTGESGWVAAAGYAPVWN